MLYGTPRPDSDIDLVVCVGLARQTDQVDLAEAERLAARVALADLALSDFERRRPQGAAKGG
jgi:predicted nucleotidyltransferase